MTSQHAFGAMTLKGGICALLHARVAAAGSCRATSQQMVPAQTPHLRGYVPAGLSESCAFTHESMEACKPGAGSIAAGEHLGHIWRQRTRPSSGRSWEGRRAQDAADCDR